MSAKAVRKSYYTTTALASVVGRLGEFSVDITKGTMVVFDGSTAGGIPLALQVHTHTAATDSVDGFESAADHVYLYHHTHPIATSSADGFLSAADKVKIDSLNGGGGTPIPYTPNPTATTIASRDTNGDTQFHNVTATNSFIGNLNGNADTVTNGVYTSGTYSNPAWITSLAGSKATAIPDSSIAAVNWSKLSGTPPGVSIFANDAHYVNTGGSITGTSGGVLSTGGRETNSPTPLTVVYRDSAGRSQAVDPVASQDIATKHYVDLNLNGGTMIPQFVTHTVAAGAWGSTPSVPFSELVFSYTGKGQLVNLNIGVIIGGAGGVVNTPNVGITVDGGSEVVFNYPWGQFVNGSDNLNLSYKTSISVRVFGTTIDNAGGYYTIYFGTPRLQLLGYILNYQIPV